MLGENILVGAATLAHFRCFQYYMFWKCSCPLRHKKALEVNSDLLIIYVVAEQPLGQLPVLRTSDGVICQTNTIARYVAKKLGELALIIVKTESETLIYIRTGLTYSPDLYTFLGSVIFIKDKTVEKQIVAK